MVSPLARVVIWFFIHYKAMWQWTLRFPKTDGGNSCNGKRKTMVVRLGQNRRKWNGSHLEVKLSFVQCTVPLLSMEFLKDFGLLCGWLKKTKLPKCGTKQFCLNLLVISFSRLVLCERNMFKCSSWMKIVCVVKVRQHNLLRGRGAYYI